MTQHAQTILLFLILLIISCKNNDTDRFSFQHGKLTPVTEENIKYINGHYIIDYSESKQECQLSGQDQNTEKNFTYQFDHEELHHEHLICTATDDMKFSCETDQKEVIWKGTVKSNRHAYLVLAESMQNKLIDNILQDLPENTPRESVVTDFQLKIQFYAPQKSSSGAPHGNIYLDYQFPYEENTLTCKINTPIRLHKED